jgi:hypothetical protein
VHWQPRQGWAGVERFGLPSSNQNKIGLVVNKPNMIGLAVVKLEKVWVGSQQAK